MLRSLVLSLCLFALSPSSRAAETPAMPLFEAEYGLHFLGLRVASAKRRLRALDAQRYEFVSDSQTAGLAAMFRDDTIYERSLFILHQGRVRPLEFTFRHDGSHRNKRKEERFDWEQMQARSIFPDNTWEVALEPGALDMLAYQIQLMLDLRAGKREFNYLILNDGELERYPLEFAGEETLDTELGQLHTLKFVRRAANKKRYSTLWCAPKLAYVPVQIEHKEPDDEPVRALIENLHFSPVQHPPVAKESTP